MQRARERAWGACSAQVAREFAHGVRVVCAHSETRVCARKGGKNEEIDEFLHFFSKRFGQFKKKQYLCTLFRSDGLQ